LQENQSRKQFGRKEECSENELFVEEMCLGRKIYILLVANSINGEEDDKWCD
jgi:hypothetical protein